jgi:NitT/TauT family transport system permease protein
MSGARRTQRTLRILAPLVVAVMFLAGWQALVTLKDIPPYIVPSPSLVAHTLYVDHSLLLGSLAVTMEIAIVALALATALGVVTALVFVQSRWIEMSFFRMRSCCRSRPSWPSRR